MAGVWRSEIGRGRSELLVVMVVAVLGNGVDESFFLKDGEIIGNRVIG